MSDANWHTPRFDETDRQLIELLQGNGRTSTCEIADQLNCLSDRGIRYRLERLQRESVIRISAIVNTSRVGFPLMGDVFIEIAPWKLPDAVKKLAGDPRVCYIAASPDLTELSLQVNGYDQPHLMQVVAEITAHIEGIKSIRVVPLSRVFRDVTRWVPSLDCEG